MALKIGDLITFAYPAVHLQNTRAHDKYPHVLVLHPGWINHTRTGPKAYLHGLNFNYLSDDEINMIRMIIDPGFQLKYYANMARKNPNLLGEFDRIIARAGNATITSPHDFYIRVIRPFIQVRGWDPYRLYAPEKMTGVKIVQSQSKMLGEGRRALFGAGPREGTGRDEKAILQDLAQRKAMKDQNVFPGKQILTPTEERFIMRLFGRARAMFDNYKKKFQFAKGPAMPNRMPSRAPNFASAQKQPSWMDNEGD